MDNLEEVMKRARKNFENVWKEESSKVYGKKGFSLPEKRGKRHILSYYLMKVEEILLEMGFDQVFLTPIWDEKHVKMQYGPEAPAILDRLYYLAALPRPDIAISRTIQDKILEKTNISIRKLQKIFREYKMGSIDSGELLETFVQKLKITTEDALFILSFFPELGEIKPDPTSKTLISHFTTAWFPTLASLQREPPVLLYTAGWRFRREQREDKSHLRTHYNVSFVIMDDIGIEDGIDIVREFFRKLDMDVKFQLKENQPSYYAYNTNYEVFWNSMEVADIGMFSPVALAHYRIKYPVFNAGPGLGRIAMVKEGLSDLRQVHFPELHGRQYTDTEILESVYLVKKAENQELVKKIVETARKYKDSESPCTVFVYEDKTMRIELVEEEGNMKLVGPAGFNEIYVYDGSIYGVSQELKSARSKKIRTILEKGVTSHMSYMEAFANAVVFSLETGSYRIGMVKALSDINLDIPTYIREFIRAQGRIDVRGPMFTTVIIS
jgi:O-phosphoseryl-tRNA synthetase